MLLVQSHFLVEAVVNLDQKLCYKQDAINNLLLLIKYAYRDVATTFIVDSVHVLLKLGAMAISVFVVCSDK